MMAAAALWRLGRATMKKQGARAGAVSRRTFMKNSAGAGVVLASGFAAPNVIAETAPIKLGNINTYTGGLAYAGEANFNAMSLYFDSINWTVAGRKIELIKEDDQFNPQIGLQKAKKLVESDNVDLVLGIQASNVALAVLN
jgi:branched-chain amino acid transport system substrate-binding protein